MAGAFTGRHIGDRGGVVSGCDPIGEYVAELRAELGLRGLRRRLVGEVEAHLHEAVAARVGAGVAPERAVSEAIGSFGAPHQVAAALEREVPGCRWLPPAVVAAGAAAVVVAFAVVPAGPTGRVGRESAPPRAANAEVARVAGPLRLSPQASEVLATAQTLGRQASACLLEHGGRANAGGGISDPSGKASAACQPSLVANERYLDAPAFREVLAEAQPRFEAAERCVAAIERAGDSAAARSRLDATGVARSGAGGPCHRRDGLPAATA